MPGIFIFIHTIRQLLLSCFIVVFSAPVFAQTTKAIEYFFDNDPGPGNGIRIAIPAAAQVDLTLQFDIRSVSAGIHQLYIRAMDNDNHWGIYHVYPVFKGADNKPVVIQKLEYYFDTDPGVSKGIALTLTANAMVDAKIKLDLSGVSEGVHTVFIRAMDNTGKWSLYNTYPVIKGPGYYQPLAVQQLEYFIDQDPGVGKAIPIPAYPNRIIDSLFVLQLPNTDKDTVHLFIRGMDNRGMWGLYHDTTIAVTCALYKFNPSFTYTPALFCINTPIQFTDSSVSQQQQWHWRFGTGDSSRVKNPSYKYSTPGNYEVSLYVVNARGCISDTSKKLLSVASPPVVDAGSDLELFAGDQATLNPSVSGSITQYLWSPGSNMTDTLVRNPVITADTNIMYKLTVTSSSGCTASDSLYIKILKGSKEFRVPNIFTPNNDGINDTWAIPWLNNYREARVQVFNRYGQKLFESTGYFTAWDGRYKGQPLPFGTYYYIIEPGRGVKPLTGYVTIIR